MPRIVNLGESVNKYCERTGNGASTYDVCANCAPLFPSSDFNDTLKPYNSDEPQGEEGWGEEGIEHPCYSECDDYRCAICDEKLTEDDN
jgi:hypothetical protein